MISNDTGVEENEAIFDEIQHETQDWHLHDKGSGIVHNDNQYLRSLTENSFLQEVKIRKAFNDQGSFGLFRLFLTNSFMNAIRKWTNKSLRNKGLKLISEKQFRAYIGLEMAISIVQMNGIQYYWKQEMFTGHVDFKETMSRNDFKIIRGNIELRDPDIYNHDEASADPM